MRKELVITGKNTKKILEHYGEESQAFKTIEELAELQRAIARMDLDNIHEEIADVLIMISQLINFNGIDKDKITDLIEYKVNRQLKRIDAGR